MQRVTAGVTMLCLAFAAWAAVHGVQASDFARFDGIWVGQCSPCTALGLPQIAGNAACLVAPRTCSCNPAPCSWTTAGGCAFQNIMCAAGGGQICELEEKPCSGKYTTNGCQDLCGIICFNLWAGDVEHDCSGNYLGLKPC